MTAEIMSKSEIEQRLEQLPRWQQDAFASFAAMIADEDNRYPCVPGRLGFASDHLRFGFAPDPRSEEAVRYIAELLHQYGSMSRSTGKYASLVMFFRTDETLLAESDVQAYERLFWRLLSEVSGQDDQDWPEAVSQDPEQPSWEFSFGGQPYFAFCATPAHKHRRSRSFPVFMIAFQPRWVFEDINDKTAFGRNMKKVIRERLAAYDEVPVHPSLKWYGQDDNLEWKQYFLHDDNSALSRCPFHHMKKEATQE